MMNFKFLPYCEFFHNKTNFSNLLNKKKSQPEKTIKNGLAQNKEDFIIRDFYIELPVNISKNFRNAYIIYKNI